MPILRKHGLTDFKINYIDDILIFSKTFTDHVEHLRSEMAFPGD